VGDSKDDELRLYSSKQHVVSVEIQKLLLAACERTNIDVSGRINPHALERQTMRNRRNNQPPVVFKPYEAAIEQVINAWR
jgi:hypothetical protein